LFEIQPTANPIPSFETEQTFDNRFGTISYHTRNPLKLTVKNYRYQLTAFLRITDTILQINKNEIMSLE